MNIFLPLEMNLFVYKYPLPTFLPVAILLASQKKIDSYSWERLKMVEDG
jgi:hypothetical protein